MHLKKYSKEEREKLEESIKINEQLIKKNPALGLIREDIIYDREFLLEVQGSGYNPLDSEDVQNFLDKKPPKNLERNLMLCGAHIYGSLGQSEYQENDMEKYLKLNPKMPIKGMGIKSTEDTYLTDFVDPKSKSLLLEQLDEAEKNNKQEDSIVFNEESTKSKYSLPTEESYRKRLASVFGSQEIFTKKEETNLSASLIKTNTNAEKLLELIKELRALGYTPEEIKKEIQKI